MIPANTFTVDAIVSNFISPNSDPYIAFRQVVLGGLAIGDPSKGRTFQRWVIAYEAGTINVKPENGSIAFSLIASDVLSISLSFDNNMGIVIAWRTITGAKLYYYNSISSTYTTREFIGPTSCRVCVDDARDFNSSQSDVIFAYTKDGKLYYRQQRDRYDVEYLIGTTTKKLIKAGPNEGNRLQFELA